jgi:hypothetical protein
MAEIPKIIQRLNIFDQIIFHIDNDPLHCNAAIHDKNNSGAEVHIAKIVNQINKSDTLKCLAILTLVLIKWLDEKTKKYKPTINTMIARIILLIYL